eukprot:362627-Chlamydomonas_euryale.AAC.5
MWRLSKPSSIPASSCTLCHTPGRCMCPPFPRPLAQPQLFIPNFRRRLQGHRGQVPRAAVQAAARCVCAEDLPAAARQREEVGHAAARRVHHDAKGATRAAGGGSGGGGGRTPAGAHGQRVHLARPNAWRPPLAPPHLSTAGATLFNVPPHRPFVQPFSPPCLQPLSSRSNSVATSCMPLFLFSVTALG